MADTTRFKKTKFQNVFSTPQGGHYVRARVTDPSNGKLVTVKKTLATTNALEAFQWLTGEIERIKTGRALPLPAKTRFAEFAAQLLEEKMAKGEIKSASGHAKWVGTLEHLIAGTTGEKSDKYVTGFGDVFVDKLHTSHIEQWKLRVAELIAAGDYAPTTANGWLSVLRVVCKAAKKQFALHHLATEDVSDFDTSDWITYSEETPNTLLPEQVPLFLERAREAYPQHYAMVFLGFATGLRPSSLRPLRRRGPEADVQWERNRILIRRSQSIGGGAVMNMTKQRTRYAIDLPQAVMDVLTWHVEHQLYTEPMRDCDLLFPSIYGDFRATATLQKPFYKLAEELGLPPFTPRGMRRTYNDLARKAGVIDLVTRSISGHATEQMQHHYSTVSPAEQRESIGKVIQLFGAGGPRSVASGPFGGPLTTESGPLDGETG